MKHHLPLALFCLMILAGCAQKQELPAPDTIPALPSSSRSSLSPDGNTGAACTSHGECQTPGQYLLRSSCPFTSRCIAHRCAVVCEAWQVVPDGSGAWKSRTAACKTDSDCDCTYSARDRIRCSCVEGTCMAVMK